MPLRFSPCGGDCPCGCDLLLDDFSSNTIALYTQTAGTWSISSGSLQTSSANALILPNKSLPVTAPYSASYMRAADVQASASGAKIRFVFNRVDANNYHFSEVEIGISNSSLRLFQVIGGTATQVGTSATITGLSPNEDFTIDTCATAFSEISATVYIAGLAVGTVFFVTANVLASSVCGLATSTLSGTVKIGSLQISKHYDSDAAANCPKCTCYLCYDSFDRTNTTTDSAALGHCLQKYGTIDVDIVSNELKLTAGTDSGVVFQSHASYSVLSGYIALPNHSGAQVTKVRFVFGQVDASNYGYWEFEQSVVGGFGQLKLTLGQRASGTDTALKTEFWYGAPGSRNITGTTLSTYFQVFYDRENGHAAIQTQHATNTSQPVAGYYQWTGGHPTGKGMGVGYGNVQDRIATISEAVLYVPNSGRFWDTGSIRSCGDFTERSILTLPRWNYRCGLPPDEVLLDLTGLSTLASCNVSALNATYSLQSINPDDETAIPYRLNVGTSYFKNGRVYRYTLPSPVCSVHKIDFWMSGNNPTAQNTVPHLFLVGSSSVVYQWRFPAPSTTSPTGYDCAMDITSDTRVTFDAGMNSSFARVYLP